MQQLQACHLQRQRPALHPPPTHKQTRILLQVLGMSYEFYQGQMSGELPAWNALLYSKGGWKKSAHLNDGSPIGVNLVGGFYDAGGMCVLYGWGPVRRKKSVVLYEFVSSPPDPLNSCPELQLP